MLRLARLALAGKTHSAVAPAVAKALGAATGARFHTQTAVLVRGRRHSARAQTDNKAQAAPDEPANTFTDAQALDDITSASLEGIAGARGASHRYASGALDEASGDEPEDDFVPRVPAGSVHIGTIEMPAELQESVERVIAQSGFARKELFEDAAKLAHFITNRGFEDVHVPYGSVRPTLQFSHSQKYSPRLVYGPREALAYLIARQPIAFANTARVLHELYMRDATFEPRSMLDFGSGVGSAVWAAHEIFGEYIKGYTMVDSSMHMLTLAEQLLLDNKKHRCIRGVRVRQYLPPSPNVKHDLIVSAYSLCELPDQVSRLRAVETLWRKTRDTLVLVEDGSPDAFQVMLGARDLIIQLTEMEDREAEAEATEAASAANAQQEASREASDSSDENGSADDEPAGAARAPIPRGMHVFAPCPHEKTCPRAGEVKPCHFPQRAHVPQAQAFTKVLMKQAHETEKFSYMVFRRGERKDSFKGWHRLIHPPKFGDSHARIDICHADGYLQETVVSRKQGKKVWKDVRRREWGDLFPDTHLPQNREDS